MPKIRKAHTSGHVDMATPERVARRKQLIGEGRTDFEAIVIIIAESIQKPFGKIRSRLLGKKGAEVAVRSKRDKKDADIIVAAKCYRRLKRKRLASRDTRFISLADLAEELKQCAARKGEPSLAISVSRLGKFTLKRIKAEAETLPN